MAGTLLGGLLSVVPVVVSSPPAAAAPAEETTPLVPGQPVGSVPAQRREEAGKALPAPKWPAAAEATVDLSEATPGEPGTVTPEGSASPSEDPAQIADVVEVLPVADTVGTQTQLQNVRAATADPSAPTSGGEGSGPSPDPAPGPAQAAPEPTDPSAPADGPSPEPTDGPMPSQSSSPSAEPEEFTPDQVDVRVLDRQEVAPAGGVGMGLQITRTDGVDAPGQVEVAIDYSGFQYAYGGDFASRLRLVRLPACALQTPSAEECTGREQVPVDNDTAQGTLTATVVADPDAGGPATQLGSASASVYALTTGSSSDKGDYRASTLSPTGSWEVATGSGAFTYNFPISMPAPAMGKAPSLGLSYNSQAVDGRTSATNNQASPVGMGWELNVGYIERRYRNCAQDGLSNIGDLCWDSPNTTVEPDGALYVINLNGVTSNLVQDNNGTGSYHLEDDPGWRVQRLTGGHGADDEYWVVSPQDGQRYYFGWGRSERTGSATGSVYTVPVVGNNAGEPCHSQFPEPCSQAYRWNMDRAVDANEVESVYFYDKETNHYRSVAHTDKARSYTSGGYLSRIEYGWPTQIANSKPTGKVELSHVGRCVERMADADPLRSEPGACPSIAANPSSYPDVPIDLMCDGTAGDYHCAGKTYYPTFFNKDMLWDIKTYVLNTGADGWDPVQQFQTKHGLPNPAGSIGKTLWLDYIQRKTYGTGTDIVLPVVNFNGVDLDNKVGSTELNFRRISAVHGDLGATTTVTYGAPNACSADSLPSQSSNTKDCFWQKWTPEGETEARSGWFKKFLVTKVTVDPTVTSSQDGAPEITTTYDYQGGAGWRFTADPLVPDEDESWSQWRGYQRVEVTTGGGSVKNSTFHWLYRGLDGDRTSKTDPSATRSVTVSDGEGALYPDSAWLAGRTIETSDRDGTGSSHRRVFHRYWTHNTAQYEGLPDARFVREDQTITDERTSSGWRSRVVQNEYDSTSSVSTTYGLPVRTDDLGETGVSDNSCTTYGRAYNTDTFEGSSIQRWMVLVDETRHYAAACADRTSADNEGYVVTLYDGATDLAGNKPGDGNATEVRTHTSANAYQQARYGFDAAGRLRWKDSADSHRSTITYSPEHTWPLDGITTSTPDPDGPASARGPLSTTVWNSRLWGVPYQTRDANGKITKITLDAAGRPVEVWRPTETGTSPSLKFSYSIPTTGGAVPDSADGYPRVATHTLQSGTTYLSSYSYIDGLGRSRETQSPIRDGVDPTTGEEVPNRQVTVVRYDSAGNTTGQSAPFRNQGTAGSGGPANPRVQDLPSYTELTLDWAGRTTRSAIRVGDGERSTASPKGWTQTAYHGDHTTVTPAAGGSTDTHTDIFGRTSKVVEHNGTSTFTTQYDYTSTGALRKITDPRGNETEYTYDWAGQRITTQDPDAGRSTTVYDADGLIEKVTSNNNQTVLDYGYDSLGRKTSVSSAGTVLATWQWDGAVPNGKGQITQTTSRSDAGNTYTTKVNAFDERGRPLSTTVTLPAAITGLAGDYTTGYTYDAADHVTSVTYPAAGGLPAETVTTAYDSYGRPHRLTSPQNTYVRATVYDAYGRLTDRHLGQNTTDLQGPAGVERSYAYHDDDGTRWLASISTTTKAGPGGYLTTDNQKDSYTYDAAGKITSIKEAAAGQPQQLQCFSYDDQHRLTRALTRADACSSTSGSDFTGPAPYQTAYSYDRLGNLQTVTDTGQSGQSTTRDYLYPGYDDAGNWTTPNTEQPHGVRKINHNTAGTTTGTDTFIYDDAGQMTKRVTPDATTDYRWTKQGRLATVTTTKPTGSEQTRYVYDADGNLLVRVGPQETVAHVAGMELRARNGNVTATRYYTCGTTTVAMRTTTGTGTTGGRLTYLLADQQASAQLAVEAHNGTTTRRRYTPFGDERGGTLPTGTSNGFLGKPEDTTTGLSLLGARAYDPLLGRFLSPDPLTFPYAPQNLSAYSYSDNDPVNYSDPTGLARANDPAFPECKGFSDCGPKEIAHPGGGGGSGGSNSGSSVTGGGTGTGTGTGCAYGYHVQDACQIAQAGAYTGTKDGGVIAIIIKIILPSPDDWKGCATSPGLSIECGSALSDVPFFKALKLLKLGELKKLDETLDEAGDTAKKSDDVDAPGCTKCFLAGTDVLMADVTTKNIEDIEVGDKVQAKDPETGESGPRRVTHLIVTEKDRHFNELSIATEDGIEKLTATHEHPFWSPSEDDWTEAADLTPGTTLLTDEGDTVIVTGNRAYTRHATTYNLTVDDLHTYYVVVGQTPVLVHNSGGACKEITLPSFDSFEQARNKALDLLGEVDPATRQPYIGRLESAPTTYGKVVGFTTRVNGEFKRFRMDYDPVKGPHINVEIGKGDSARKWAVPWNGTEDDFARMLGGNS
ncbi:polymorphic toxin-type HINT domain-containing protein [Streptomyces sp. NPDC088789]|uniref:polymorphic toxin-type HINT domain-containing protein n=1 Tax=Streptomyces sp. NPDC088789 TaxID=3365899 RepID=UPI003819A544